MRVAELRPGWATEFILHRCGGEVEEQADCVVVRTPVAPTFYWGNCLLLPRAPGDDELAHWLQRFDAAIGSRQPASRHVAIGVHEPFAGQPLAAWTAAGFHVQRSVMLGLVPGALRMPPRPARAAFRSRPLALGHEDEMLFDLECTDSGAFEPVGYRAYLRQQGARYRQLEAAGQLHWFGAFVDGVLAASCGLMRDAAAPGAAARFQRVITHPDFRRRGLCSALVHDVARFAIGQWQASAVYMAADPTDVAIGIYRTLGWQPLSEAFGLQRNAPEDRGR